MIIDLDGLEVFQEERPQTGSIQIYFCQDEPTKRAPVQNCSCLTCERKRKVTDD